VATRGRGGLWVLLADQAARVGQPHTFSSRDTKKQVTGYKVTNFLPQTGTAWEKKWKTKSRRLMHLRGFTALRRGKPGEFTGWRL
jgi:hypothetical protein